MTPKTKYVAAVAFLFLNLGSSSLLLAQAAGLSGKVTNASGAGVANAVVTAKQIATGQVTKAETDLAGTYTISNLALGQYEVSASAEGLASKAQQVTLNSGGVGKLDFLLAPSGNEPLLSELGFPSGETQGNAREQALLDKRAHMLKIHQRMGLITAAPLLATVLTGSLAGEHSTSSSTRDLHAALGATSTVLYFTTASYAIFAPKLPKHQVAGLSACTRRWRGFMVLGWC